MQNTSHAVMAQRSESKDSLDDFPTPPWATRAFVEHILGGRNALSSLTCLEPACGRGDMAQVLREYFQDVKASDVCDYGFGELKDFTTGLIPVKSVDWIITNPPFRLAEEFLVRSLATARKGVALLTRTVFIESVGRFERIFDINPPTCVAQYVERVPMVKGRLDPKASTATGYAWLIWECDKEASHTELKWVPPSRKRFERKMDYMPEFRLNSGKHDQPTANQTASQRDLFVITT